MVCLPTLKTIQNQLFNVGTYAESHRSYGLWSFSTAQFYGMLQNTTTSVDGWGTSRFGRSPSPKRSVLAPVNSLGVTGVIKLPQFFWGSNNANVWLFWGFSLVIVNSTLFVNNDPWVMGMCKMDQHGSPLAFFDLLGSWRVLITLNSHRN